MAGGGVPHRRERYNVCPQQKEPKPKLLVRISSGSGGGLPREGVGAGEFGMSLETQGNQTLGRNILGFLVGGISWTARKV